MRGRLQRLENLVDLRESDLLPAVVVKELWQGLRRIGFVVPFLIIHLVSALLVSIELLYQGSSQLSWLATQLDIEAFAPFWMFTVLVIGIVMPGMGVVLMRQELDHGNHELLQLTTLTRWRIILGKWSAVWMLSLLTLSSLLPYFLIRYFRGGVDVGENVGLLLFVVCLSSVVTSLALAISVFKPLAKQIGVGILFGMSTLISGSIPLLVTAGHFASPSAYTLISGFINLACTTAGLTLLALLCARSRLKLKSHQFEVSASSIGIVIYFFLPLVVGLGTVVTLGQLGGLSVLAPAGFLYLVDLKDDQPDKAYANL